MGGQSAVPPADMRYLCELCAPRPISRDVLMRPQPEDALAGCTYYLTLMRSAASGDAASGAKKTDDDDLQVRVGECFYVMKPPPAAEQEQAQSQTTTTAAASQKQAQSDTTTTPAPQSDGGCSKPDYAALMREPALLAIFRVERLWIDEQ